MKKILLLLFASLCAGLGMLQAQTEVTVGTGTSSNYYAPFGNLYENSWNECIYSASEINSVGNITAIAYNVASAYSTSSTFIRIYLGTTTATTHTSYTGWVPASDLTLVYEAQNTTIGSTTGWETFTLNTPFYYDGSQNLVVVVARASDSWNSSLEYYYTEVSGACMYRWADDDNSYAQHPGTNDAEDIIEERPNIKLTFGPVSLTCPPPSTLAVTNVNASSATFSWNPGGTETSWDIVIDTVNTTPDSTTVPDYTVTDTFYTFQTLNSSTQYYVWVRANCGGNDFSMWRATSFLTSQIPATLPYSQDWEDAIENAQWTIDNSGGVNKWYIGTAANNTTGGTTSLYISNTNGQTNAYDIGSSSNVWAYRDIDFGTYAEYGLSCDVRVDGESCCDYLKIFVGPPAIPNGSSTPTGAVQVGSNINLLTSFTHVSATLNASFSGVQRVYFLWHNDGSVGTMPPAAIDNISIIGSNCGSPYALSVDSIATTTVQFSFTAASASDNSWQAVIVPQGAQIDETDAVNITDTTYEFTGLTSNTAYQIYVRTNCGSEYSNWSTALGVRTDCDIVTAMPITENFDTYGTGISVYMPCWSKINTYSSDRPYVSSTHYAGTGSLYFYAGDAGTYNIAIMPEIDATIPVNTLQVSFMYRASSASDRLIIGVMTDPNSVSTFVPVDTVHPASTASNWELREVALNNYTGNGQYIAFLNEYTTTYGYAYMDELTVDLIPTCLRPIDLTVANITDNGAMIDWTPRNNETSWQIVAVPAGTSPDTGTVDYASTHPYTLSGLMDNTQYDVYVKSDCGGETSIWSMPVTFHTACLPNTAIPYVEDFNNLGTGATAFPNCWERYQSGTTTNYPYVSSTGGHYCLYFYGSTSISNYATSQAMNFTAEPPGTLELSFDLYKSSASYGRMNVGYMTDPADWSTFHQIKAIYPADLANTSTWYHFTAELPASAYQQTIYLAFQVPMGATNYLYMDDVTVDYRPDCSAPTNLNVSNISGNSALLTWEEAPYGVMDYTIEYVETGSTNVNVQVATGSSFMLTGLDERTDYDIMLYGNCSMGYSDTLTISFSTLCNAGGSQVVGNGTSSTYYIPVNTFYKYSYVQELFTANEIQSQGPIYSIGFQYTYSTAQTKNNFSIYLAETDLTSLTTWIPYDSLHLVYNGSVTFNNQGDDYWVDIPLDTAFNYSGTRNLVVVIKNNHGSYTTSSNATFRYHSASGKTLYYRSDSGAFDFSNPSSATTYSSRNNIKFGMDCDQTVTCIAPNMYVSSFDPNSITIDWVPGDVESSWILEYQAVGDTSWTSLGSVSTNPYVIDNLSSNTTYNIRMSSDCVTDTSVWSTASVTIPCYISALPYVEDFDMASGSGSSYSVPCWTKKTNNSTAYPYPSSSYYLSSPYSLYFYGSSAYYSMAVSPRFDDAIEMDSLVVSFWGYKTSDAYSIEVGVISNPDDMSTFTSIGQFSPSALNTWERAEFTTAAYEGNGHYLAFRIPQWVSDYFYVDDLTVNYILTCSHPNNLVATNIETDNATISWTPGDAESEWEYVYGPAGTVDPETATTYVAQQANTLLTGLNPNTTYDFYVRSMCSSTEYSHWMNFSFTTECLPITTLPYTQNFDSMTTGTNNITSGPNNISDCWAAHNTGTSYTAYPYIYYSSAYANSGSYSLRFYTYTSSSYANQYAILPEIDTNVIDIHTLQLTFDARTYSTYPLNIVVGVMTDENINTFIPTDTITLPVGSTSYATQYTYFTNFTGSGNRLALMVPRTMSGVTSYQAGNIDNVTLDVAPACIQPLHLQVDSYTNNSVTLSWNEMGNATSWYVEYGTAGFTPGTGTVLYTSTNPFTVDNLAALEYEFYVRSDCGSDTSAYSQSVMATPGSYNMPTSGTQTITTCSAIVYDNGGASGEYSNNCSGTLIINPEVSGNMISISGTLTTESSYDYLRVYNGSGTSGTMLAEYTGSGVTIPTLTSTTGPLTLYFYSDGSVTYSGFSLTVSCVSITCPTPTNLTFSNVSGNAATVNWTPAGSETSWIVEYKTSTSSTWNTVNVTTTSYTMTGLTPLTTYDVRVKADCGNETSGALTGQITTPNCTGDACEYTFVLGDGYGDGWNNGYLTVQQGGATIAVLEAVDHNQSSTQTYDTVHVYLCDNVVTTLSWSEGSYDDEVSVYVYAPDGTTAFSQYDFSYFTSQTFTPACGSTPTTCNAPTGLAVNNVTTATATATWTAGGTETSWNVQYKAASASSWQSATANATSYTMTGLTPGTAYQVKVQANCGSGNTSDWTTAVSFTTANEDTPTCPAPTGLTATVDHTDVTLTWQQEPNTATEWQINYRLATESTWSTATATSTTYTLTDLTANAQYVANVVAHCTNGLTSDESNTVTFETNNIGVEDYLNKAVTLYPNPATEMVSVAVSDANIMITGVEVYNVYGQLINTIVSTENPLRINVSGLADGMYYVRVTTDNGVVTKNFVKK